MAGCAAPHTWPTSISRSVLSPTTQTINQATCCSLPSPLAQRPASRSFPASQLEQVAAGKQGLAQEGEQSPQLQAWGQQVAGVLLPNSSPP